MSWSPYGGCCGMTRRGFLAGAGAGLVTGVPLTWLALRRLGAVPQPPEAAPFFTGRSAEVPRPRDAMPGPFPGRVIEVRHRGAVNDDHSVNAGAVRDMMARGMTELTGADHPQEAWRRFFGPGDVVGIKVNPVGRARPERPGAVGAISKPEIVLEVAEGLKGAGVKPRDIIVFERYADEFRAAGYETVMGCRALDGVRWYASATAYDDRQLDIEGDARPGRRGRDPHVLGYDPDVFVHMGFSADAADPRDDRRFRSHLSLVVTTMVNKIVSIPVLKDHRSAGVTGALKNLSHGLNNNVARSHLSGPYYLRFGGGQSDPNQCNTFIPTAAGQPLIRQKATLHIVDGLIGVYEGGPGCWNPTWGTWRRRSLFFATDPVATDHVGWWVINRQRQRLGLEPVERMGKVFVRPAGGQAVVGNQSGEQFDRRQPEHVALAGTIGMGVFERHRIEHRTVNLRPG